MLAFGTPESLEACSICLLLYTLNPSTVGMSPDIQSMKNVKVSHRPQVGVTDTILLFLYCPMYQTIPF